MPELPEVERAAKFLRTVATGKRISRVQTSEDDIVFSGIKHDDFASEIEGRTVITAGRYGKVLYIDLDGPGKMPVLHFGMTGMFQVKGEPVMHYKEAPRKHDDSWPPKFMKFILNLSGEESDPVIEIAFLDARRLGRIRLCLSPSKEPPISELGFDPILSMPSLDQFRNLIRKRNCPVKALLLDQSFSAGVGNWVADEILYHARIHPEQRCKTLTDTQIEQLHLQTSEVCRIAVDLNADDSKFPEDWLFKHRWGKGKNNKETFNLPSGEPATIKWVTVGGRTSAYVTELQRLTNSNSTNSTKVKSSVQNDDNDSESDLTPLSEAEKNKTLKKRKATTTTKNRKSKKKKLD